MCLLVTGVIWICLWVCLRICGWNCYGLVVTLLVFVDGILRLVGWLVVGLDYLGKWLFYCDFGGLGCFARLVLCDCCVV